MQSCLAACHYYELENGTLPIGIETRGGMAYSSWRPKIWYWAMKQPSRYDESTSWDSAANKKLLETSAPRYLASNVFWRRATNVTNLLVVVGDETAFPIDRAVKLSEIQDGLHNTILFVEILDSDVPWTKPEEIHFHELDKRKVKGLGNGALIGFADGKMFFLTSKITEEQLRSLFTIAGGEPVYRRQLIETGALVPAK